MSPQWQLDSLRASDPRERETEITVVYDLALKITHGHSIDYTDHPYSVWEGTEQKYDFWETKNH